MKVFVDGLIFGRQRCGGISRMWEEFLKRIPALGVTVHLLVPWNRENDSLKRIMFQKERFLEIRTDFSYWPKRVFEKIELRSRLLECFYLDETIDVFHSTYFSTVHRKNVKKVITIYDMILELFIQDFQKKWADFGIRNKRKAIENADAIIAISQTTKQDILRIYPFVPAEKITVIPLGAPSTKLASKISFPEMAARRGLAVSPGKYFLYVGNRDGYKNFSLLPQSLSILKNKNLFFVCIGGENFRNERNCLRQQGVEHQFLFVDHADDDELQVLYRNARAMLFPSRYEGFGLPLLEAMANDCPVLCADTAIFHEIGGDAPVYFSPDSPASLARALESFSGYDRMELIKKGRMNAGRFSWDASAHALAQLYRSLEAGA